MHCGDQRHLGLCLGYVPALAYGSCRVSDQGTTLRASDLHNARATILNPFIISLLITSVSKPLLITEFSYTWIRIRAWISNYIPHKTMCMITYPCLSLFQLTLNVWGLSYLIALCFAQCYLLVPWSIWCSVPKIHIIGSGKRFCLFSYLIGLWENCHSRNMIQLLLVPWLLASPGSQ